MTTDQFDTIMRRLNEAFDIPHDDLHVTLTCALNEAGIEVEPDFDILPTWKLLRRDGNYAFHEPHDFDDAFAECQYVRLSFPEGDRRRIDEIQCFENGELVAKYDPVDGSRRWQKGEPKE